MGIERFAIAALAICVRPYGLDAIDVSQIHPVEIEVVVMGQLRMGQAGDVMNEVNLVGSGQRIGQDRLVQLSTSNLVERHTVDCRSPLHEVPLFRRGAAEWHASR